MSAAKYSASSAFIPDVLPSSAIPIYTQLCYLKDYSLLLTIQYGSVTS